MVVLFIKALKDKPFKKKMVSFSLGEVDSFEILQTYDQYFES